ncbi:MAG: hypothetical protein NT051_00800 [Candidatus Micrarchaeota archaeon]|nr:hypothetical protein [Candidatus Micrarchaeota archaeon]
MAEQAGEAFRSYAINLKDDCSLSFLPSGFFDFVVCTKLVDFKDLSSNSVSPVLMRMCDNGELEKMAVRLMMESSRLLANGGKMAATFNREDRVFQKNGKELVLLKK